MANFDLIPNDYRRRLWLRRSGMRLGVGVGAMALMSAAACLALYIANTNIRDRVALLERQQEISVQQRDQLMRTNEAAKELERQLDILAGLRSGTAAPVMFAAIDSAMLGEDVWFLDWEFLRAGTMVEKVPEARNTGYFIISKPDARSDEAWLIETRMRIVGQARDHSALSTFVRRLFNQDEIEDVRILSTSLAATQDHVDFELKVTVDNSGAES